MSDSKRLAIAAATHTEALEEAKLALEISRSRYYNLYAHAPVAHVTFDRDGVIRDVNVAGAQFLKSTVAELLGKPFLAVVSIDQRDAFWGHIRGVLSTREAATAEVLMRIRTPRLLSVRLMSAPIGEHGGEVLTALLDMTEQRRGEQIMLFLDRAAMLFGPMTAPNVVADQLPALAIPLLGDICVVELRNDDGTAHVASAHRDPALSAALRGWHTNFTRLPRVRECVERAFSTAQPQVIESLAASRTGELRELSSGTGAHELLAMRQLRMQTLTVVPLVGRGQVFGVVALATLIGRENPQPSDLPIAVELARRAALAMDNGRLFMELHDANQAKDHFLAVLSHELRTPLTPVLAAVSAAIARGMPSGADLVSMLEMIERNVQLERRLIDDLLDLSRVTRGKLELSRELTDLHAAVQNAAKICRHDADAQSISVSLDLRAERHHVDADPARLEQILWNLLKNAIKFTERGGSVHVATAGHLDAVRVSVSDTGIGIDPRDIDRIFAPFTQAEASMGRRQGGMGLGLAISRMLAQAHGGKVFAESRGKGRGSTFVLDLPASRTPVASDADRHAEAQLGPASSIDHPIRVLLVEDDADTLEVTSTLLREWQYQVATADTVAAARTQVESFAFDVLVSDINLPDGSGLDLMRELRSSGNAVPGIALSGFGTRDDVERAKSAGFAAHLTKPITFPQLATTIGKVLREALPA